MFNASSEFFQFYIVTELVKLVNKMKQIRNSMTILFLLSFCISFVLAASVPILHDDYGKYPTLAKTEIICPKNVGALIAMKFT